MSGPTIAPNLITSVEAAEYLGVQPVTVTLWRHRKIGPKYYKIGRLIRYKQEDLDQWVEANGTTPTIVNPENNK